MQCIKTSFNDIAKVDRGWEGNCLIAINRCHILSGVEFLPGWLNYKYTKGLFLDESFCPPVKLVLPSSQDENNEIQQLIDSDQWWEEGKGERGEGRTWRELHVFLFIYNDYCMNKKFLLAARCKMPIICKAWWKLGMISIRSVEMII